MILNVGSIYRERELFFILLISHLYFFGIDTFIN